MYILTITIQSRLTVMNHKAKKQVVHDEQVSYLHVAPQAHEKVYDENERNKKKQRTHKNVIDGIKEALYRVLTKNRWKRLGTTFRSTMLDTMKVATICLVNG